MPIGSSKAGVLGAGTVPGGSETFNSSGTFSVPTGVSVVSVTAKGGNGAAGNTGNSGNAGNGGGGGGGGIAASSSNPCGSGYSTCYAGRNAGDGHGTPGSNGTGGNNSNLNGFPGNAGNTGNSGSAGSTGAAGGTTSGLRLNFVGGNGGTAGNGS